MLVRPEISRRMRRVRARGTSAELILRRALRQRRIPFQTNLANLPGKPDIVISSKRLAIFIDGDFWHGNQWRRRGLACLEDQFCGRRRKNYWLAKIRGNMRRDLRATDALLADGWNVLRFWESDVLADAKGCLRIIMNAMECHIPRSAAAILAKRTVAEFFAGIGLMRLGLEREGWSIAFANDLDEKKLEMYQANFPDAAEHYLLADIHRIPAAAAPTVALATASFPCNDLSLAGGYRGLDGKNSSAFWGFTRILRDMKSRRPPLILLENVVGFLSSKGGDDFRAALSALNELGYAVDAFILDAEYFTPQSRPRLFVVGILQQSKRWKPAGLLPFEPSPLRPRALCDFIFGHGEIRWLLRDLPTPRPTRKNLADILENFPQDSPQWWPRDRADYLFSQMSPRHRLEAERMMRGREISVGTIFRRVRAGKTMAELRTDGTAGCLRTPRGGSARQILFQAGGGEFGVRLLTPRECARLQGADDFQITVGLSQALFGFGDAVCVPVISWIAKYYLNPLVNELIRGRPMKRSKAALTDFVLKDTHV